MKARISISDFTHDDLVNLLSTALYGNDAWCVDYDKETYEWDCVTSKDDCLEDKLAKLLLVGYTIEMSDRYSESEEDVYGDNKHVYWDEEHEVMTYPITLLDIKEGLEKAYENGEAERVNCLINEPEQMDMIDADVLMQYIVYGEVIYG